MVDRSSLSPVGSLFHAGGLQTSKHAVQIERVHRQLTSVSPRCTPACVQEATCGPSRTTCTGSSLRLVTSATRRQPGSHCRAAGGFRGSLIFCVCFCSMEITVDKRYCKSYRHGNMQLLSIVQCISSQTVREIL